ncbi:hypothetical protein BDY21DRAFT_424615 [Lineolata rhizophorae]|uniref:Uncharacterized protein n=1 Tax=Lineolata rhizophorae TaxID=578093 RepID=A0A6A6NN56_9PEZI|nr:hypothetical protein BDY21DRAFT_424615 [Lineolata rhizophorae]
MALRSLDELLELLVDGIALRGDKGTSLSDFRSLVQQLYFSEPTASTSSADITLSPTPNLDDQFLSSIWDWLLERENVKAARVRGDGKRKPVEGRPSLPEAELIDIDLKGVPSDDVDQVESANTSEPPGATSGEGSGDSNGQPGASPGLRLFTTENNIWKAITGHTRDYSKVSRLSFALLQIIASRGKEGIAQPELTKLSGQDPRSISPRTSKLADAGYIEKKSAIVKGQRTAMLTLSRFADDRDAHESSLSAEEQRRTVFEGGNVVREKFLDALYQELKDTGVMVKADLKIRFGLDARSPETKSMWRCIVHLEELGIVKRVMVKPTGLLGCKTKYYPCVKLLRAPTAEDRATLNRESIASKKRNRNRGPKQNEPEDGNDAGDFDGLDTGLLEPRQPADESAVGDSNKNLTRVAPLWNPDIPMANLVFEAVSASGVSGINAMELRSRLFGEFWTRPLDDLLMRVTKMWLKSQPPHLRHMAVIREATSTHKMVHYLYRTFPNFTKAIEQSATSWNALEDDRPKSKRQRKDLLGGASFGPGPKGVKPPSLDQWGFPEINAGRLASKPNASLSELFREGMEKYEDKNGRSSTSAFQNRRPGRPRKQKDSLGSSKMVSEVCLSTTGADSPTRPLAATNAAQEKKAKETERREALTQARNMAKMELRRGLLDVNKYKRTAEEAGLMSEEPSGKAKENVSPDPPRKKIRQTRESIPKKRKANVLEVEQEPADEPPPKRKPGRRKKPEISKLVGPIMKQKNSNEDATSQNGPPSEDNGQEEYRASELAKLEKTLWKEAEKAATDARTEELAEKLLSRMEAGVFVNPVYAKRRTGDFGRRGRPPKALVVVFRFEKLRRLDWFQPGDSSGQLAWLSRRQQENTAGTVSPETPENAPDYPMTDVQLIQTPVTPAGPQTQGMNLTDKAIALDKSPNDPPRATLSKRGRPKARGTPEKASQDAPGQTKDHTMASAAVPSKESGVADTTQECSQSATILDQERAEQTASEDQDVTHSPEAPTSRPQTPMEMQADASQTPRKHGIRANHSMVAKRVSLLVNVVKKCDGICPAEFHHTRSAIMAQFMEEMQIKPDKKTLQNAVLSAVNSGVLRQVTFTFATPSGVHVTKQILTTPDIDPRSPTIQAMQRKMIEAYPLQYVPEAYKHLDTGPTHQRPHFHDLEVDESITVKRLYPPMAHFRKLERLQAGPRSRKKGKTEREDKTKGVKTSESASVPEIPHVIGPAALSMDREALWHIDPYLAAELEMPLLPYEHRWSLPSTYVHPAPVSAARGKRDMPETRYMHQWAPIKPNANSICFTSRWTNYFVPAGKARPRTTEVLFGRALTAPAQFFHSPSGTFSTNYSIPAMVPLGCLTSTLGDILDAEKDMPNIDERLNPYQVFVRELDQVHNWELSLLGHTEPLWWSSWANHFIVHELHEIQELPDDPSWKVRWDDPESEWFTVFREPTFHRDGRARTNTKSSLAELESMDQVLVPAVTMLPQSGRSHRQRMSRTNPTTTGIVGFGYKPVSTLLVPAEPEPLRSLPARPTRGPLQKKANARSVFRQFVDAQPKPKGGRQRTRQDPRCIINAETTKKILYACIVVKVLVGGVEEEHNWILVDWLFREFPHYDRLTFKNRWNLLRIRYYSVVEEVHNNFQDRFLRAYKRGEIPLIDYDQLADYDWDFIVKWAEENVPITKFQFPQSLPNDRRTLESAFQLHDVPPVKGPSRAEFFKIATIQSRSDTVALELPFFSLERGADNEKANDPAHSLGKSHTPLQVKRAESFIRANLATPDNAYDPKAARSVLETVDRNVLEYAVGELSRRKDIMRRSKGRAVPGRQYDFTERFLKRFRGPLTHHMLQEATCFKRQVLDAAFADPDNAGRVGLGRKYRLPGHLSDGGVLALENLESAGRVRYVQALPRVDHELGTPYPKMSKWGFTEGNYRTKQMDRGRLAWDMDVVPTPAYVMGNPALGHATPPVPGPQVWHAGSTSEKLNPIWTALTGRHIPLWWDVVRTTALTLLVQRGGGSAESLSEMLDGRLEVWEVMWVLGWLEKVGAVVRMKEALEGVVGEGGRGEKGVRKREESKGRESEGWIVGEWWWLALGEGREKRETQEGSGEAVIP